MGSHGGGEGRGHIVSPRAQLVLEDTLRECACGEISVPYVNVSDIILSFCMKLMVKILSVLRQEQIIQNTETANFYRSGRIV